MCEVTDDNVPAKWFKNCTVITNSDKYMIQYMGKTHKLTISKVDLDDAACYSICVNNRTRRASLAVRGKLKDNFFFT